MRISVHMCVSCTLCEKVKVQWLSRVQLFSIPWAVQPTKLLHPWGFPGKSTGVGCHFLLQGIFPTQGSNRGLPHCRPLYRLSCQGSPKFLLCLRTLIIYILQMRKLRSREINQFKVRWLLSEGVIQHPTLSTAYVQNHYFTTNVSSLRQFL